MSENKWISTKDNPPPKGTGKEKHVFCLVVENGDVKILAWNCTDKEWDTEDMDDYYCVYGEVTHWMPLPEPPC
jgi:hypothetical protein